MAEFNFVENTFMVPYTKEVADYCAPFFCGDEDLDEFFSRDVFLYEEELLGKTFCWINKANQREIVAIATLSYDGIKTFKPLYKTEESEKETYGIPKDEVLRSRIMFFDLKLITA